jgi:hypothetical protein
MHSVFDSISSVKDDILHSINTLGEFVIVQNLLTTEKSCVELPHGLAASIPRYEDQVQYNHLSDELEGIFSDCRNCFLLSSNNLARLKC